MKRSAPRKTPRHPTLRLATTNGLPVDPVSAPVRLPLAADEHFLLSFYRAAPPRVREILQRAASLMAQEAAR